MESDGKLVSFSYKPSTDLSQLYTVMARQFPKKHIKLHVNDGPPISFSPDSLSVIGNVLVSDVFPYQESVPLSVTEYGQKLQIRLKCSDSESVLSLHSTESIALLKLFAGDDESHLERTNDLRMRLDGHQEFLEESKTLEESGVEQLAIIHLEPILRGGSGSTFGMIDVFNDHALRSYGPNPAAPRWRVLFPGFAAEGYCTNQVCEASGDMPISNHGFGVFNFDKVDFRCPICSNQIVATNLLFCMCFYSIRGFGKGETVQRLVPWRKIRDKYHTWDPQEAAVKQWKSMQITTRHWRFGMAVPGNSTVREAPIQDNCSVCMKGMKVSPDISMLRCTHSFHRNCINAWQSRNLGRNCPQCNG